MKNLKVDINTFANSPAVSGVLANSQAAFLIKNVVGKTSQNQDGIAKQIRLIVAFANIVLSNDVDNLSTEEVKAIGNAFYLVRAVDINDKVICSLFVEYFNIEHVDAKNIYYFILSVLGLLSDNTIKARIDLDEFRYKPATDANWGNRLINDCVAALILLVRKKGGLADVNDALSIIDGLKDKQKEYEKKYLDTLNQKDELLQAYMLLSFYHIGKILTEIADYLRKGYIYKENIVRVVNSHYISALEAIRLAGYSDLIIKMFAHSCVKIYQNSIWFNTLGLGSKIEALCDKLVKNNILDLLPSQKSAISQNLLDTASNVTVVQMPTSAGKSLLAEFKILQSKALNDKARVLYIVPNRALVNQVLHDLREDFSELDFVIEKTSRTNEIDPSEDLLLHDAIDILVSTPEKADLLMRKKHASIVDTSLVIIDEAHTIQDGERGARLELLLAIIKRELPKARFMLLSPFMPNAELLTNWLATGRNAVKPISVAWKPSDKVFIGVKEVKKKIKLSLLPSAYSLGSITHEIEVDLPEQYDITSTNPKARLLEFTAKHFSKEKSAILYLCWGKTSADKMALSLQDYVTEKPPGKFAELVAKYIEEEAGCSTILSTSLRKRIAIHHAGLTDDVKTLVEHLVRSREVDHICATTTVANGMNFPISAVYFDDYRKGRNGKISLNDFLNITGRAGRTLVDNVGKIIFPFNSNSNIASAKGYIQNEINDVTSALSGLIIDSERIVRLFSEKDNGVERAQVYSDYESLGVLTQYLVHLLTVSNEQSYISEIEEIFRDSYGFYSLKSEEEKAKFINICRAIYADLNVRISKGTLSLADKTGFSVPSIIEIMKAKKEEPQIASAESWESKNLFNNKNDFLASKISVIAKLREVQLGTESGQSPFNPEQVAKILIGWVQGEKLDTLSKMHPHFKGQEQGDRMNDFVTYLSGATFKSAWGLSVLEGIVKNEGPSSVSSYIPSMVYYGVNTPRAVTMRMIGAPRIISDRLANLIVKEDSQESLVVYRKKVASLPNSDWESITPSGSKLSGAEWKEITGVLVG